MPKFRFYKQFLPSILTSLSLILALVGLRIVFVGNFFLSFAIILLAFASDMLDGFFARRWEVVSRFGRIFDSFADIFIYLLYPAAVIWHVFQITSSAAMVIVLLFLIAGIYRLWRFTNTDLLTTVQGKAYQGLPVYFSIFLVLGLIVIDALHVPHFTVLALILMLVQSFLMVLKFPVPKPRWVLAYALLVFIGSLYFFYLGL